MTKDLENLIQVSEQGDKTVNMHVPLEVKGRSPPLASTVNLIAPWSNQQWDMIMRS